MIKFRYLFESQKFSRSMEENFVLIFVSHSHLQIFENVVEGKVFQTISCYKPRNLITFNVNGDTLLAFIQDESEVKVSETHSVYWLRFQSKDGVRKTHLFWPRVLISISFFHWISDVHLPPEQRICWIFIIQSANGY